MRLGRVRHNDPMARIRCQAICIRHLDWSETSQVVVLLTPEHGKVRGLAKGSKRMSPGAVARFSGGIELLTRGEIVGMTRPSTGLAALTEWDLQDAFGHLRRDLRKLWTAMYAADLADALVGDLDPHPEMFDAMQALLEALADTGAREAALLAFQWSAFDACGFRPRLDHDVHRDRPLEDVEAYTFDAHAGGLTTASLAVTDHGGRGPWRVRRETVQLLRDLDGGAVPSQPKAIERANRLLCVYIRSILDRQLPTMEHILGDTGGP
ncbi:MAG: DNA repair protein RecO [Phycisphaeraceae bacterium]|nr:DNA repair protein RecO [Phycisphaeraceae bacterium]